MDRSGANSLSLNRYKLNDNIMECVGAFDSICEPRIEIILNICKQNKSLVVGTEFLNHCLNYDTDEYNKYLARYPIYKDPIGEHLLFLNKIMNEKNPDLLRNSIIYKELFDGRLCAPPKTPEDINVAIESIQQELKKIFKESLRNTLDQINKA